MYNNREKRAERIISKREFYFSYFSFHFSQPVDPFDDEENPRKVDEIGLVVMRTPV